MERKGYIRGPNSRAIEWNKLPVGRAKRLLKDEIIEDSKVYLPQNSKFKKLKEKVKKSKFTRKYSVSVLNIRITMN